MPIDVDGSLLFVSLEITNEIFENAIQILFRDVLIIDVGEKMVEENNKGIVNITYNGRFNHSAHFGDILLKNFASKTIEGDSGWTIEFCNGYSEIFDGLGFEKVEKPFDHFVS